MSRKSEYREMLLAIVAVLITFVLGTIGYVLVEGWNWFDSFYMTVITLFTIGFQEVHPLSPEGRAFTIVLIILGVGVASLLIVTVSRKLLERQVVWLFEGRPMRKEIESISNHIIFCGYGRLTRIALSELEGYDTPVIIIDKDEQRRNQALEDGYLVVQGDATVEATLVQARISTAQRLVTVLPKDADNLYVVLTSRELNPSLAIISRAEDEHGEKRLLRAGANQIISPYRVGGQKIAYSIVRPFVSDFLELAISRDGAEFHIEEILIPEKSPLCGMSLQDAQIRQRTNIMVAAIISRDGTMKFNPAADSIIEPGSTLIGLGLKEDFAELARLVVRE